MNSADENIKLFKTIFDQTPVSTQVFTPDGKTLMVNKAWEDLWNVKSEHVKSYNILKDQQLVKTGSMPYIKRGFKGETVSIPAIRYDPRQTVDVEGAIVRWLSAQMYPIKNNKGKITHIVLQHRDITERKKFEESLKESQDRLRATWDAATDAMTLSDSQGLVIDANNAYFKLYGYSREEVIGKSFSIIFPKEIQEWAIAEYKRTFYGKEKNAVIDAEIVSKDGKKHIVESRYSFITLKRKRIAMLSVVRDITANKKAEEALRESEERLRIALDAGNIGVWDWNIKNDILTWTDNVYKIHGVDKKTFRVNFNTFQDLIHPDDQVRVVKSVQKSLKYGAPFNIEFRVIGHDKKLRWVATSAMLIYDIKKTPIRMLGATSEITQQKQLEQEKSDFLSMASHELKTPITSMKMFVELLHKELRAASLSKPSYFAARIKDQTNRLAELTNDLLDVSRIETGKLQLKKEVFNIRDLVHDSVESLQATTKHTLFLQDEVDADVLADRYRLFQVLVNLITNAIKYSPENKKVIISLRKNKEDVVVSVTDYGIGIAKDKQEKVFDRLYQVADPKEKTFPGLGLGLYISKEIVERHGGKLWLKSAKGKGATFYFSLELSNGELNRQ